METDLTEVAREVGIECDTAAFLPEDYKLENADGGVVFDFAGTGEVGLAIRRGKNSCIIPLPVALCRQTPPDRLLENVRHIVNMYFLD